MITRIAIAVVLITFVSLAFCREPNEILKGYEITLGGKCNFNNQGKLEDNGKIVRNCFMAVNPKKLDSFLLLVNDEKNTPHKIIEVNILTEEEKVIWVKGNST